MKTHNIKPCVQDRIEQIASQGHMKVHIKPCLQDRIEQIGSQGDMKAHNIKPWIHYLHTIYNTRYTYQ